MKKVFFLLFSFIVSLSAQNFQLTGIVKDSETGSGLYQVNVFIEELNAGATTNNAGFFKINLKTAGDYRLSIRYLGYSEIDTLVNIKNEFTRLTFSLVPKSVLLKETIVQASRAQQRKTPVAFAQVTSRDIDKKLGSRDVVYSFENTPSVFISPQGGGTGDLRLNMRGFGQTNIGIMLNGVPVNNPENGEVYWTNWAGVSDMTNYIEVQRGLGAAPYSVSAIGGVVNIVTKGVGGGEEFTKVRTEFGSENFNKVTLSFSQELSPGKLGISGLISKKNWDGYADRTWHDEFTYYLTIGSIIDNHSLELQILGSPQNHGQRITLQRISYWKSHGKTFNSDWGYLNGKPLNLRDNVFHTPTVNLNHNWQINKDVILSNTVYFTYGQGGGTVPPWSEFSRTKSGLIDFDREWEINTSTKIPDVNTEQYYTANALRFTLHKHWWSGFISNIRYQKDNLGLSAGIDFKYYTAENYRRIENLLGGDYTLFSGDINKNAYTQLYIGDKTDYNADSFVRQLGGFAQAEYSINSLSTYVNASVSSTGYKRIDYFNYKPEDAGRETYWKDITGFTLKHGYNYNINSGNNLFVNAGYFSRAPLSENVYDYSNNEYEKIKNETIFDLEAGYGFSMEVVKIKINGYYTSWQDKAIRTDVQDAVTGERFFYNISGADARHTGFELEGKIIAAKNLIVNGMFSYAVNKWRNNVSASVAPESNPLQRKEINSYVKDVYVGGFPMTTASLGFEYSKNFGESSDFFFNPVYNFAGRHYAQYNPDQRTDAADEGINSWRLPDYFLIDVHLGYSFSISEMLIKNVSFVFHVYNVLDNTDYLVDAIDGSDHTGRSALVWYGRGRWWHLSTTFEL